METWMKVSLLLSVFGFLKEFRPSESFNYEFLIGPWRNVTEEEVNQEVYPVRIYAHLTQTIVVLLIGDLCRYKLLMILLGASGIVTCSMLLWTTGLLQLQILEIFHGTFMATEFIYYTYIYVIVDKEYYEKVILYTRTAILAGGVFSNLISQLLISLEFLDYRQINYLTFAALIGATIWSVLLPSKKTSVYFHRVLETKQSTSKKYKEAFYLIKSHFLDSFTNKHVVKWSIWWALVTCGFYQVQTYIQPLWFEIQNGTDYTAYNGATKAAFLLMAFLGALVADALKIDWKLLGELALAICSIFASAALLISSQTDSILVSYICYIVFGGIYCFIITIASSEILRRIPHDSYGLVFSINSILALIFQSIMTTIVTTYNVGFALTPRDQHLVYGFYHLFIAFVFILIGLGSWFTSKRDIKKTYG